jgi:FtsZ-binding cell division protein ZapB
MDETVIYQLMNTIDALRKEIEKLREDMEDLRQEVAKNTLELSTHR